MSHFRGFRFRASKLIPPVARPKVAAWLRAPKANQTLKSYLRTNSVAKTLAFFRELLRENPGTIDSYSFLYVLKACTKKPSINGGQQVHAVVKKFGLEQNVYLVTCLIDLYSAAGNLGDARRIFDEIPSENTVCWTSLISAYVDHRKPQEALKLFRVMHMNNMDLDQVTLTVAMSACASIGALGMGEWIHSYVRHKDGFESDMYLKNALLDMYVKCGEIEAARSLFHGMEQKDVTTWTSMIVGHALHGQAEEALNLFSKMKPTKNVNERNPSVVPNDVSFLGVLMACSHAGLVEEGKHYFRSMIQDYGLKPRLPHFGCIVDLLCRSGVLQEAYDFILRMPVQPNAVIWRTLLGACFHYGNVSLGADVRELLLKMEPTHVGDDVALSNIFALRGFWGEKLTVRDRIKSRRTPGYSSIEVESEISEFVAGDECHSMKHEIYEVLNQLMGIVKVYGYMLEPSDLMDY